MRRNLKKKYSSINALWHGARQYEEIAGHIAWCDVVLHPTVCLEVFGLNIAEALAVGRPVIASRCGGAEAQISDRENGLLIPLNDSKALSNQLLYCIDHPQVVKIMADKTGPAMSIDQHIHALEIIYGESC
jgi:glycosyltransferase involved in cell wall biosynthesis